MCNVIGQPTWFFIKENVDSRVQLEQGLTDDVTKEIVQRVSQPIGQQFLGDRFRAAEKKFGTLPAAGFIDEVGEEFKTRCQRCCW